MAGFDLLPGATVHPAASARIMAAMLSPPLEAWVQGRLQHDVICALAPELTGYPVNPTPLRRRVRTTVSRARRTVCTLLARATPHATPARKQDRKHDRKHSCFRPETPVSY